MNVQQQAILDPLAGGTASVSGGLPALYWLDHPLAQEGLRRLREVYEAPSTHRPGGMLIYGDTNNGKTMLALRFAKEVNKSTSDSSEGRECPVIYVQSPPGPDIGALYSGILMAVNAPFAATHRPQQKQEQIIHLLPQLGTRMIIIDELHNILAGKVDRRNLFLNGLKFLSNELRIPLVAIGTNDARVALQTDQQLGNRFRPFHLSRWKPNPEYSRFVIQLFRVFDLDAKPFAKGSHSLAKFHSLTGGLTGETWSLVRAVALHCRAEGMKKVTMATVDATDWLPPDERRKA